MKRFYIAYYADNGIMGYVGIETTETLDTFESIERVRKAIMEQNNFKNVVILNWKELGNK